MVESNTRQRGGENERKDIVTVGHLRYKRRSYRDIYKVLECVGEGTYGVVTKATEKSTGNVVALKRIRTNGNMEGLPATSIREIKILKNLKHPNIIRLNGVFHEPREADRQSPVLLLEFDYLECDLRKFMKHFPQRRLPIRVIKLIMYQMLDALDYCHSQQIIHRDLKPSNVLVEFQNTVGFPSGIAGNRINATSAGRNGYQIIRELDDLITEHGFCIPEMETKLLECICVKIADFGLARIFPTPIRPLTHEVVTLWYRAPEVVLGFDHYTAALDVWSMGCILLELLYGRPVILGDSESETLFRTFQLLGTPSPKEWRDLDTLPHYKEQWPKWNRREDRFDFLRGDLDNNVKDLLDRLLEYAPEARATAREALLHPWFEDIRK